MQNRILEGHLNSMSYCISMIKEKENNKQDVNEYLDSMERRIKRIREEVNAK